MVSLVYLRSSVNNILVVMLESLVDVGERANCCLRSHVKELLIFLPTSFSCGEGIHSRCTNMC